MWKSLFITLIFSQGAQAHLITDGSSLSVRSRYSVPASSIYNSPCLPKTSVRSRAERIKRLYSYNIIVNPDGPNTFISWDIIAADQVLSDEEIEDIEQAVLAFPSHLLPFPTRIPVYFDKSLKAVANSVITLGSEWRSWSRAMRVYGIFHELSHRISDVGFTHFKMELSYSQLWLKQSGGWDIQRTYLGYVPLLAKPKDDHQMLSQYGATNPIEDWAESISSYRFNPTLLEESSPTKYQYLKNLIFGGIEYKDLRCHADPSLSFTEEEKQNLSSLFNERAPRPVRRECRSFAKRSSRNQDQEFKRCLVRQRVLEEKKISLKKFKEDYAYQKISLWSFLPDFNPAELGPVRILNEEL